MPATPYGQAAASTGFGQAAFGSDASNLVLAIATGFNSVSVFQSKNGGSNWTSIGKGTFSNAYDGLADVSVAAHGANIVILANPQSGSNSYLRSGDVMVTANSGSTWKSSRAPVGGTVTAGEGVFWLVGGPERDKVFESADGVTWVPVVIPVADLSWSADIPTSVTGLGIVLSTTSHSDGPSHVRFWASSDHGKNWNSVGVIDSTSTASPITVPASITGDGHWFLAQPDGARIYTGTLDSFSSYKTVSPNGLGGVNSIIFSSSGGGLAVSVSGSCPSGKDSCTSSTQLVSSVDGGQTWGSV